MKTKKILIINGHPYQNSFCAAVANTYKSGADLGRHKAKLVNVRNLRFDLVLHAGYRKKQRLEEGLIKQQELIKWCDHLVIVTPMWWMGVPALLKGYFDRVFLPDFAFRLNAKKFLPERLLKGRSARVVYTQGGSQWAIWSLMGDSFWEGLSMGALQFWGFSPVKRTVFSKVPESSKLKRLKWLNHIHKLGFRGK